MSRTRTAFAVALLAACAATAQEPKKEPARLDLRALGEMLTDLGAEPKPVDNNFQKVRWTTPDWGSPVWLSVSGNKQTLWLYTEFDLRPDFEKAPGDAWRAVLEKNDSIGPTYFALDEKGKRLTLRRPVANADVTAAKLRKELNSLVETVQKTQHLWRAAAFLPVMTPEALKVIDRLAGTWTPTASTDKGKPLPAAVVAKFTFEFAGTQLRVSRDGKEVLKAAVYVEVRDGKTTFDFVASDATDVGILKFDGDTLTLCSASGSAERPAAFASTEKPGTLLMVLRRKKP